MEASVAVALCQKDLGRYSQAIAQLEETCHHPQAAGDKARSIQYELALLYKVTDAIEKALHIFDTIADYQDVRDHINELRQPQTAPAQ